MNITNKLKYINKNLLDLKLTDIAIYKPNNNESEKIIIVTARSNIHLNASAKNIIESSKKIGLNVIGYEGAGTSWTIIDLAFVVIHVMLYESRQYYELDKLFMAKND